MQILQSIRGFNDLLPDDIHEWHEVETILKRIVSQYGYREIRLPVLEKTALFHRSIGEVTDIVEKEMYTFDDRAGESLSLRPEGTAGCARACLEHHLLQERPLRIWYNGPMYRYERPQKGRYRQFYQFGLEAFGIAEPDIDAEILCLTARFWKKLGIDSAVKLKINSLGVPASRNEYRQVLVEYFEKHHDSLDADSQRRLYSNPLRILDSKNPQLQELIQHAPTLHNYLDEESARHFKQLQNFLNHMGVNFEIEPRIVRGLDYYTKTVFEWQTDLLGSQNAVCAGGRYDGLIKNLGGKETPGIGFSIGIERVIALRQLLNVQSAQPAKTDVCFIVQGISARAEALKIAEQLREALPKLCFMQHCSDSSFKAQFKWADKCGARFALILGDDEIKQNKIAIKALCENIPQQLFTFDEAIQFLKTIFEETQ